MPRRHEKLYQGYGNTPTFCCLENKSSNNTLARCNQPIASECYTFRRFELARLARQDVR